MAEFIRMQDDDSKKSEITIGTLIRGMLMVVEAMKVQSDHEMLSDRISVIIKRCFQTSSGVILGAEESDGALSWRE